MASALKRINDVLAGLPMTIAAGVFLLLDLVPHLAEEFSGNTVHMSFLPFDPAWVTIIVSGIPLLYLAIWRIIHNHGISKISSALLICIAMFAALAIGELFAAGEVAFIMALGALLEEATTNRAKKGLKKLAGLAPTRGRRIRDGKEEMTPAMELSEEIIENVDILSKLNANELTSVALSASSKAMSIIGALKTSIYGYISEIVNIMNNPYLSDSEIQSKIKLISDKIKASADEATTKISQLFLISETIVSLSSTFAALKGSGSEEFNDFASTLKQMLSCMNTKPSDFSEAKNKSDINETLEKNKNNLFGGNMTNKFKEKAQKAEINIKTCEEKLKQDNLTDEEKKRIKSELVLFKAEKNLYESISN